MESKSGLWLLFLPPSTIIQQGGDRAKKCLRSLLPHESAWIGKMPDRRSSPSPPKQTYIEEGIRHQSIDSKGVYRSISLNVRKQIDTGQFVCSRFPFSQFRITDNAVFVSNYIKLTLRPVAVCFLGRSQAVQGIRLGQECLNGSLRQDFPIGVKTNCFFTSWTPVKSVSRIGRNCIIPPP